MDFFKDRFKVIVDVHLFLLRDGKILLGKRQNTGFSDGMYHMPAGHLEAGETFVTAILREAEEELGLQLNAQDIELAYVLHHHDRVGLFFTASNLQQEPKNMEPEKCAALTWFDLNALPDNIVAYAKCALDDFRAGKKFGVFGWDDNAK